VNTKKKFLAVAVLNGIASIAGAGAAHAQTAEVQKVERVEVTGSNIKRIDQESAAPVLVITRENIERSGQSTVSDLLRSMTINNGGAFDEKFTNSFAPGTSGVSLRGLGQNATLVLINGRRVANYSFAQNVTDSFVDLNSIPLGAIDRVEVLKDGASAIYGSDAIAGVINIILRRDFRGVEVQATYGATAPYNDANELRLSGAAGIGDVARDRYNALLTLDYYKRDPRFLRDREYSRSADNTRSGGADARSPTGSPGTYLFNGFTNTGATPAGVNTYSRPFSSCKPEDVIRDYWGISGNGDDVCGFNFNNFIADIIKTERVGATGRSTFQITPKFSLFAEAGYSQTKSQTLAAPTPGGFALPVGHNSNPYEVPVRIAYRFLDVGPRTNDITSENTRVVLGAKGEIAGWDWEAALNKARNTAENVGTNFVDTAAIATLVSNGVYNFVNPAANSAALTDSLRIRTNRLGVSDLTVFDAKASREIFALPAGPIGMAVGAEFRQERGSDTPDAFTREGRVVGSGGTSSRGERNASAGYVEFSIAAMKNLEVQLAGRYDQYDGFGGKFSPKVAFRYSPSDKLMFRGSFNAGFRAPSLAELFVGDTINFPSFIDGPRCNAYRAAETAGRATADEVTNACRTTQYQALSKGNPDLKAEKSQSFFLGSVFEPIKGWSIGLDWFLIKHENKIAQPLVQYQLANADAFPGTVVRSAANARDQAVGAPGRLRGAGADTQIGLFQSYYNLGSQESTGFDIDLRWKRAFAELGEVSVESTSTYYTKITGAAAPGQPVTSFAGTYRYPRFLSSLRTTWQRGPWEVNVNGNYTHHYLQVNAFTDRYVKSFTTVDLIASYAGFKNTKLTVGIRNLMDTKPPFSDDETEGYDFGTHDSRGRFVYGTVKYSWK
jgi:iron complex outermembrane recepter protein